MSDVNDRPLAHFSTSHIIGFLGLAGAGVGAWLSLNVQVADVRSDAKAAREAVVEQARRSERIEDKVDRLLIAEGIRPEN